MVGLAVWTAKTKALWPMAGGGAKVIFYYVVLKWRVLILGILKHLFK